MQERQTIERRILILEGRIRVLTAMLIIIAVGWAVVSARAQPAVTDNLRVRQITVVDRNGVERVWIGAPVPDPIVQGVRGKRVAPVSGVVVLDAKGNERGAFVTTDPTDRFPSAEVFLSLDSERGQEATFLVNPGGGGHLTIDDPNGNLARIGVLRGRPTLLMQEKGQVVFEQPLSK